MDIQAASITLTLDPSFLLYFPELPAIGQEWVVWPGLVGVLGSGIAGVNRVDQEVDRSIKCLIHQWPNRSIGWRAGWSSKSREPRGCARTAEKMAGRPNSQEQTTFRLQA